MHIHILGICGTFMAGIAQIAKQLGYHVTGSDQNVYPPMSTQLEQLGIELRQGYLVEHLADNPDCVIIGNAMSRGNPMVEAVLNQQIPYISGPEWLAKNVLHNRWVLAVAGTHGKTTTSSMLTWILEYAKLNPGFLIGGIPENFNISARLGDAPFFVIEADEYDSAFFDKRSKFIHYHPRTLILNNLEFDHADIFPDLAAIQKQFHYLVRTVPGQGLIIADESEVALQQVFSQGCWTPIETIDSERANWQVELKQSDASEFSIILNGVEQGVVNWQLLGNHNAHNALAAIAAARHAGVTPAIAIEALNQFVNVKRRMEVKACVNGVTVYDDFAHHPTAIDTTIHGLRQRVGEQRILAVLEFGSFTMRNGVHKDQIAKALANADQVYFANPETNGWELDQVLEQLSIPGKAYANTNEIVSALSLDAKDGDHILVMSNKGFDGIHEKIIQQLEVR